MPLVPKSKIKKKKKSGTGFKALYAAQRVTSYPFVDNRMMIVDWASMSYHMFHSMRNEGGLLDSEDEIDRWRHKMLLRLMDCIALFNPRHIIFALEGKAAWRKGYAEEYYRNNAVVYWNSSEAYVCSDNDVVLVQKASDGGLVTTKLKPSVIGQLGELKHAKLGELPPAKQEVLWHTYLPNGDPILPSYKGTRTNKPWEFQTPKKIWAAYREQYAIELAPLFKARAIQCETAEGDDIIYAAARKYSGLCDDVIVVTRDSDMAQIPFSNVKLYDHLTGAFSSEPDPVRYLDHKVLCGDSSDNVHGMAFVNIKDGTFNHDKATRLSDGGATTLMTNCPNIYEVAKKNGWDGQYMRNRTMIDLSRAPDYVTRELNRMLELPEPETAMGVERLGFWDINERTRDAYMRLQSTGFYCVNSSTTSIKFDAAMFAKYRSAIEEAPVDVGNDVISADNFGLDGELSDIDVIL